MTMSADQIIRQYWDLGTLPIDPFAIATKMGITITADPHLNASGSFLPHGSKSYGPLIVYNPTESYVRQRFTIAHELGHYCLEHGPRYRDTPDNFSMTTHDVEEIAANRFAAELLMPKNFLESLIHVNMIRNVVHLASIFDVSRTAMSYRLKNLGYIVE